MTTWTSHDHEPMPRMDDYHTSIDELRFSDKAKARMAARLADAATKEQPMSSTNTQTTPIRRRRLPLAAAAAGIALAFVLGGVAYAAGGFVSIPQFVRHLFGGGEAQVEVIDKVGRPIGVAQSSAGVTVSADAVIGDKHNVAVIFSLTKDDGTAFEGIEPLAGDLLPLGFSENIDVDIPLLSQIGGGWGATGSSYFYDADPADNAIQLVVTRSYESDKGADLSLVGRTMTAHFSDLTLYGEGEPVVIAPGDWKLSFPLEYEDASVTLTGGQTFTLEGWREDDEAGVKEQLGTIAATIEELDISPIALHLRYTADQKVMWTSGESGQESEHDSRLSDTLLGVQATVALADGTTVEVRSHGSGAISADEDVAHCETSIFFDRILDLEQVESVTIGGTTIEL